MYAVGRFLQFVGLTILPLAVLSELTGSQPNPGLLLRFMLMGVGIFMLGYLLQRFSGAISARLEQARSLAAGRNWDEAVDIWRELSADNEGRAVMFDGMRYVSLRTYSHLQIARLPADGLAAYRRRVDALAQQLYHE